MDDFPGLLARDFGFRPQGKSAPMSASKPSTSPLFGSGSAHARPTATSDPLSSSSFDDVFGGAPRFRKPNPDPSPSFDSLFDGYKKDSDQKSGSSPMPVYDKPVYDDDIFDGVPGMKNSVAKAEYEDVFASISGSSPAKGGSVGGYDDLLGGLDRSSSARVESKRSVDLGGFEELLPGFGGSSPPHRREPPEANQKGSAAPPSTTMTEDPFVILEETTAAYPSSGTFSDPLEHLGKPMNSGSANVDVPGRGSFFDKVDAFDGLGQSSPIFTSEETESRKDKSPLKSGPNRAHERSSVESLNNVMPKTRPTKSYDFRNSAQSPRENDSLNSTADQLPGSSVHFEEAEDVWLTVHEIPLFTQPTSAPPPSRPPPPLVKSRVYGTTDLRKKDNEYHTQSIHGYQYPKGSGREPGVSPIDELSDFAMKKPQANEHAEVFSSEDDIETNSAAAASAAAMKEAMDRAEAKFKHAVRERERDARSSRGREFAQDRNPEASQTEDFEDTQEKLERERLQRIREEREREREQRRLEKEREEREKARQAVERATREARERAAAEARAKAERAAVEKATAEARQRAERAAVQRAAAEARERAAAEARQRAERAAAEARERAGAEAREKSTRERAASEARERAAAERAAAEARVRAERTAVDRAHAEARERAAAAAARDRQNKTEDDLESFFGMGARASSAPKQRAATPDNIFETQAQSRGSADTRKTPSTSSSTIRKASSTTNIVDDLTSIFGGAPPSGEFQEVEGESEERRRARLERHQRTQERAAKALAEKNERDMQTQREQAERHRIAETLDIEIKRWASGKEGNLRALLSTLQYVLWPECGWQPVSLTDLITAAAVKKVYRKATLCIHPDKVQQKGANLQQKYIAEKVFDLLKEAWNKFNSEELF